MKHLTLLLAATALLAAGCGGAGSHPTKLAGSTTTSAATSAAATRAATMRSSTVGDAVTKPDRQARARSALLANHRVAVRVLWTNRVPPSAARSTRGPALAEMTASAAGRKRRGVRVRVLHDDYRIVSLNFGRSGGLVTVIARSVQEVELTHLDGTSLGKSVRLDERARIELRRIPGSNNYAVWSISLLK